MRNHARSVLACDFFVTVTATFRLLYVFVVLEVDTRRLLHWNVTGHPTAEWTVQQFRTCITGESAHRFVVHDHDTVFSTAVDRAVGAMGLRVLKTPIAVPQANAYCERLIRTARRECLDWVIPSMNGISGESWLNGSLITITAGPTRASVQVFPIGDRRTE